MAEVARHSRLRDNCGPRPVDSGRRTRSGKSDTSHRRRGQQSGFPETFELRVIGQPTKQTPLGMTVDTSVMLSLKIAPGERPIRPGNVDTSRLFAIASLVADTCNGDRMPLEAGTMTGQKLFDSVHPIQHECVDGLARRGGQSCRVALGYVSFPGLLIRQTGSFRIRVTLIRMGNSYGAGGTTVTAIDSDVVRVERRGRQY